MLQDIQEYDAARAALDRGDEELVPGEVVDAVSAGFGAGWPGGDSVSHDATLTMGGAPLALDDLSMLCL